MSAAAPGAVKVRGLRELERAFNRSDKTMRRELVSRIRLITRDVALKAREIASEEGFMPPGRSGRGTGALLRSIRWGTRGSTGLVRETATRHGGFRYPAVYEYGHTKKYGHRPFLHPALEAEEEHVLSKLEGMLDAVAANFSLG